MTWHVFVCIALAAPVGVTLAAGAVDAIRVSIRRRRLLAPVAYVPSAGQLRAWRKERR